MEPSGAYPLWRWVNTVYPSEYYLEKKTFLDETLQ